MNGKHTDGSEQLPKGMRAKKATTKKSKQPLPKCFWDIVETHLPRYFDREDVAECNDLSAKLDRGEKMTAKEKARLDTLNRKLYKEACASAATID